MKICTKCLKSLSLDNFCIDMRNRNKYISRCNSCRAESERERYKRKNKLEKECAPATTEHDYWCRIHSLI